jgi:thioesterase domain-containing protein
MLYQKARKDYRLRPLNTRALLFRAQDNGTTPFYAFDDNMGWGKLFEGGLEVVDCPGDHFTLLKAPHIQFLVQKFEATSSPLNHIPKAK